MSSFDSNINHFGRSVDDDWLIVCTRAGRVIYQSSSLIYYVEEDLTGRNLNDFIADSLVASVVGNAQQGKSFTFEAHLLQQLFRFVSEPSGENIHLHLTPLMDEDGAFINQNAVGFIYREINTALSMMFSAMGPIADEVSSEGGKAKAALLQQNMYRLMRLSRNMLDCALAEGGGLALHYAQEDVCQLCRSMAADLAPYMAEMGIQFTLTVPETPVICKVDRARLERMIYNLIANSVMAVGKRRRIDLSVSQREQGVAITVTDWGRGIESDLLNRVRRKHTRLSADEYAAHGGAGFGLALVEALAKRHGGSFFITSLPDETTLACITLPHNADMLDPAPLGSLSLDYAGGHNRVLLELSTALPKEFYLK